MTSRKFTFCRICEPHCPLVAEIDDAGRVAGLAPDLDHPVGGIACHKGLAFIEVHNDPDRVNVPLRRASAKSEPARFEQAGWDEAIADIGSRIAALREQYGPHAIGTYIGNPTAFNATLGASMGHLLGALGTRMTFSAATQDCTNKFSGAWALYGSHESNPIPDIYNTDYLLCLGANPRVSKWTLVSTPSDPEVLKRIKRRGGKVVFVNPRHIETSTGETGETLRILPGTDAYFLAAILNEIERLQGFSGPRPERYAKNLDRLRALVGRYPPERVEAVVGIDAATIREVAANLVAARSAAVYISLGVNQSRQGLTCYWLAEMINFVTGNLGRRGGTSKPVGLFNHFPTQSLMHFETSAGPISVFDPPSFPASMPSTLMPDLIEGGDIKAMIVFGGNPLLTIGGEEQLRAAFGKLELLVMVDIFRNATAEYADYVLPATDWLERDDILAFGSGMQNIPYVQYSDALVEAQGERRNEAWIIASVLGAAGLTPLVEPVGDRAPTETILDDMLSGQGLTVAQLRTMPHQTVRFDDLPAESFYERCLQHPDARVDCFPETFVEAGLIARFEEFFEEFEAQAPDALRLIMLRTPYMHNSWLSNLDRWRQGKRAINPLFMCEADAAARGLLGGDEVRVHNGNGEVVTRLEISDELRAGVVAMSHGYGHSRATGLRTASAKPGVNFNRLAPAGTAAFEPVSNMAWLTGLPVSVERCGVPVYLSRIC